MNNSYFKGDWLRFATDLHVMFFQDDIERFQNDFGRLIIKLQLWAKKVPFGSVFDLVEFIALHPNPSMELKSDLAHAFVKSRTAYRLVDGQVVAIGTEEQGAAFEKAITDAEGQGAQAARSHLIQAGIELRNGDWPGSVRESIHAVEAMARKLAPEASSLGAALSKLDQDGNLHGGLKAAFGKLYGYTSDSEGIRHALVFENAAQVDEADALFMLGACASFVSYLIYRDQ